MQPVADGPERHDEYFAHLQKISKLGRIYKRFVSSPVLYFCARRFGTRIIEVGSGTGSGILGAYPDKVQGLEINPLAEKFCKAAGLNVRLIGDDGVFPVEDGGFDVCVLDNVLEHLETPRQTLDECHRITGKNGGLVIAVPGALGFRADADHKKFYDANALELLDARWSMQSLFSIPFFFRSDKLSRVIRQYCLVATYGKN